MSSLNFPLFLISKIAVPVSNDSNPLVSLLKYLYSIFHLFLCRCYDIDALSFLAGIFHNSGASDVISKLRLLTVLP